jgi:hypothetical protein
MPGIPSRLVRCTLLSALLMLPTLTVPVSSAGAAASGSPLKVMSQNHPGGPSMRVAYHSSIAELLVRVLWSIGPKP